MYFLVRFTSSHHCLIMNDLPGLKSLLVSAEPFTCHAPHGTCAKKKTILSSSFRSVRAGFISLSSPIIKHI